MSYHCVKLPSLHVVRVSIVNFVCRDLLTVCLADVQTQTEKERSSWSWWSSCRNWQMSSTERIKIIFSLIQLQTDFNGCAGEHYNYFFGHGNRWAELHNYQIPLNGINCLQMTNFTQNTGYPATTLPLLNEESTDVKLTVSQASWFAAITAIFSPIGGLLSGYFLDKFGRRMTLICINVISIISWLIIGYSSKSDVNILFAQLMVARIIIGEHCRTVPCAESKHSSW